MYKFLNGVNSPNDIKKLNIKELEELSKDIRKFLVRKISKTGGHLASNLGIVELTLALHKVFDSPKDKIIWDVGHQAYVHKILTGRKEGFDSLRQFNGMSGFPKESESEHDIFDTGHSSTSISVAMGIASARDIKNENYDVVAVIGDGAITGGMAVEALNNIGFLNKNVIIIFNDNEMSIDKNTGAFSSYMSKIMRKEDALSLKESIDKIMNLTPVGEKISKKANKITESILTGISPDECGFIDALGIQYFGPFNGHNIKELIENLSYIKKFDGPKFVHVKTVKGKGYRYAEEYPDKYHGVSAFDYKVGVSSKKSKKSISAIVGETLTDMANKNKDIVAITAAMPTGTGLNIYEKAHPNRYFDVGICEQHAVTFAAGLTREKLKPYFAVYSTFLQRGYDQLIHDVCINNRPVTFLIDRAGLVGNDGETHHGQFDLSYLNPIPNIVVMAPKDTEEMIKMINFSEKVNSPLAIRYPRGNEYYFNKSDYEFMKNSNYSFEEIEIGKPEVIYSNLKENTKKLLILTIGDMIIPASEAIDDILKEKGDISVELVNARYLKPLDSSIILDKIKLVDYVFTIENNSVIGGFGSVIESLMVENKCPQNFSKLGIPNNFIPHGNVEELMKYIGLDKDGIKNKIIEVCYEKKN